MSASFTALPPNYTVASSSSNVVQMPGFTTPQSQGAEYRRNNWFFIPTAILLVLLIMLTFISVESMVGSNVDMYWRSDCITLFLTMTHLVVFGFLVLSKKDLLIGPWKYLKCCSMLVFAVVYFLKALFEEYDFRISQLLVVSSIHVLIYLALVSFWRPFRRVSAPAYGF